MLTMLSIALAISIAINILLYKATEDNVKHPEYFLTKVLNWKKCQVCHQLISNDLVTWIDEDIMLEVCPACWAGMNAMYILKQELPERFDQIMAVLTDTER